MDYYARVTVTKVWNFRYQCNDNRYRGCIFLKAGYNGYPTHVADILVWCTDPKQTHNEALQPLYRELERLNYNINGHKINCRSV